MSKKKEPNDLPKSSDNQDKLTPWQKANQKYLAEHHKKDNDLRNHSDDSDENQEKQLEASSDKVEVDELPAFLREPEESNKQTGPYNGSFLNRLPNLKNQRNKVLTRRLSLIITILGIPLLFLIYYISPYSKLEAVAVTGNELIPSETVITESKLRIGDNLWTQYWDKDRYVKELKTEQPRVKTAKISFHSINQFELAITEYKDIALIATENKYYPVLENGIVLDQKVDNPTKNLPILEGFKSDAKIKALVKQYNQLSAELQKAISEIKYAPTESNENLLQMNMNDGNQVLVNITNLASQMKYYPQVAKEMKENGVIDMEVGIFSYPYSNSEEEQAETSTDEKGTQNTDTSTEIESGESSESSQQADESTPSSSSSIENQ
ncbi:cell division protein FtsQ/DivIB [Enterococcus sp. DIV0660C]|uniref:cell division protein FtsQ/DivIB n=1 Tax=Enterococcus sp. DIV0660C TaxID=2230880 RepID=UPI001A8F9056|nr:cell division protein FtsQ/DivIB [Enterococcus sp. DIV0660C]